MLLSSLVFFAASASADKPKFCHGIDCPDYTVTGTVQATNATLEMRTYPGALWVSTDIKTNNEDDAQNTGFERLFQYISGANDKSEKVDMTSPVMTRVKEAGQGPFCNTTFTVSFFVPFVHQDDAPTPTASDVYLDKVIDRNVAVLQGSGFWKQDDVLMNVQKAGAALQEKAIKFNTTTYTFAGYDPPFRLFDRHNEIWMDLL